MFPFHSTPSSAPSTPLHPSLHIVTYNPLVANSHNRIRSICSELRNTHIIGLPGTGKMHNTHGSSYTIRRSGPFCCFEWGWAKKQAGINKSCGVSLLIARDVLPNKCINHIYSPPISRQGRVGAVRYKTARLDICIIVIYLAPNVNNVSSDINKRVLAWVQKLISKIGTRVTLVCCTDANSKLGTAQPGVTFWPHVGTAEPDFETKNGTLFRQFLVDSDLIAINTHFQSNKGL